MSALIQRNGDGLGITFVREAERLRENALAAAGIVGKVADAQDNATATDALALIQDTIRAIENARKDAKEPVLDFGRRLDAACKLFSAPLHAEALRVGGLVSDFQQLELAKQRAAERA